MKKVFFIIAIAVVIQFFPAPNAQAGLIEFFFPSLREEEPDPSDTLQAPFADEEAQATKLVAKGQLPENALALDKPHRDVASISEWLVTASSQAMTFDAADINQTLQEHAIYFDKNGMQEYTAFLTDKGMMKALNSDQYYIRSFVEETPLILNEGAVNGSYRWLFEVSMMVTYMDRTMKDYKDGKHTSQKAVFNIQVGRSPGATNKDGILIEHWSGKFKKK